MFLGIFDIDEYVSIPAPTHRFSSGAAYAPTSLTYSIYEEGSTTGLDENIDMAPASPFDAITGCYLSRRQLTADAGFERNKTYLVVVKATVDSVPAIDMHIFQIRALPATAVENRQEMDSNSTKLTSILEDTGTTIPGLINADSGAGAISHTYTLTDSADGNPIDGAEVWVSTDAAGVNVIASGTTNSSGIVTFMLDAGTYYFWRRRSGYNFVNPDVEIVSA